MKRRYSLSLLAAVALLMAQPVVAKNINMSVAKDKGVSTEPWTIGLIATAKPGMAVKPFKPKTFKKNTTISFDDAAYQKLEVQILKPGSDPLPYSKVLLIENGAPYNNLDLSQCEIKVSNMGYPELHEKKRIAFETRKLKVVKEPGNTAKWTVQAVDPNNTKTVYATVDIAKSTTKKLGVPARAEFAITVTGPNGKQIHSPHVQIIRDADFPATAKTLKLLKDGTATFE